MRALLFPGQGAQQVGMGRALAKEVPAAAEVFEEAGDVLGYDLAGICFDGPAEALVPTDVCQPAILTTSVAAWRAAAEHGVAGDLVMGHSLGEFSALVACGAMGFAEALGIVAERGAAMHAAGLARPGTMAALLGPDDAAADALCAEAGEAWPANYNCPGQVVVSGSLDGIERLLALAAERGIRATRLQVGGAFHSELMGPAVERLAPALDAWTPAEPAPRFLSTTTCRPEGAGTLRRVMLDQLLSPVRFGRAVEVALEFGATSFVELAPGRVLSGLVKRIRRDVRLRQVATPEDLGLTPEAEGAATVVEG